MLDHLVAHRINLVTVQCDELAKQFGTAKEGEFCLRPELTDVLEKVCHACQKQYASGDHVGDTAIVPALV
ncbi:MAG: hypothetical protein Q7U14_10435, partial [Lacisediminimonas sp.]|nr:hypothetical protein [Lacisediminimonas sp.]